MRVRMGWSGETSTNIWQKFDIELEQEDLDGVLREHGLTEVGHRLPTAVRFQLLQNEAELLLLDKLLKFGYPPDEASIRTDKLMMQTRRIVEAVQQKLATA